MLVGSTKASYSQQRLVVNTTEFSLNELNSAKVKVLLVHNDILSQIIL